MIVDLVIIIIIALFTIIGYKQGLVKTAIKILSFFIALAISIIFYKTVAGIVINNTPIDDRIEETIISKISMQELEEKLEILPQSIIDSGKNTVNDLVINVTEKIISITVFIILFIILRIALKFVTILADLITKLPIIKQFDKTGGLVYGFAKGWLIITIIFAIISLTSPVIDVKYINSINNSILGSMLYNHNLVLGIVK